MFKKKKYHKKNKGSILRIIIIFMLISGTVFSFSPFFIQPVKATWYHNNWAYRKEITINGSQIVSQQSNFPVLINITDQDLSNNVSFADGRDILFTDSNDNKIPHEIEYFDVDTGKLVSHVKVSSLIEPIDTIIYMYYHNPNSVNQSNPTGVWHSDYVAVYHMNGKSYNNITDSTSNNHDATADGGTPTYNQNAIIGNGVQFDGTDDYIEIPDHNDFTFSDDSSTDIAYTFEIIFKKTDSNYNPLFTKYSPTTNREYIFEVNNSANIENIRQYHYDENNDKLLVKYTNEIIDNTHFYYYAGNYDGSESVNGFHLYINGSDSSDDGKKETGYSFMKNTAAAVHIGRRSTEYFKGIIDEIRVSNILRHWSYIKTNQNNFFNATDGGFFSIGNQEDWLSIPNPPTNLKATVAATSITLTWNKGSGANNTMIERNTVESWELGAGVEIYNGSGISKADSGLNTCTKYYYQAWSVKTYDDIYKFSTTNISVNATTISSLISPTITVNLWANNGFDIFPKGYINATANTEYLTNIDINITINNVEYFNETIETDNYTSDFVFNLSESHGNIVSVKATDPCDNYEYYNTTFYVYKINITLIDEETGEIFNLDNCTGLNVSIPAKQLFYNMKANNSVYFNYSSYTKDILHFEIDYANISGTVFRFIKTDLSDPVIRVGIASEQQFFQQVIYSSSHKSVAIKNVYADAYVLIDTCRFAYGDAFSTQVYTIDKLYYLYTYDSSGNKVILASIDGSQTTVINLDVLEFANQTYDFGILTEDIAFSRYNNNTILMYYCNLENDNEKVKIDIYCNNSKIFTHTETEYPNNLTIYFNYATLTLESDIIKIVVTSTKNDGSTNTITRLYNIAQSRITTDEKANMVMLVISITLAIFGLTLVSVHYIFGFFGIASLSISIAITTLVGYEWYVLLVQVVFVILLVYIILVFKWEGSSVT